MTSLAEDRLRTHVAAILARAGVPRHLRADVDEELLGHLAERWRAHLADGEDELAAADRAIAEFGTPAQLGRELGRTYHSRLWASTIGVLLPAIAPASSRPGVVGWLRFVLGLAIVATAIGLAVTLPSWTPVRALGSGAALAIGLAGLILAFKALGRGQRWALTYAIAATAILLIEGIWQVVAPEQAGLVIWQVVGVRQPGSITIPLGSILGACVLMAVVNSGPALKAFVASSAGVHRGLAAALAISLFAPAILPRALAAVPDPTQTIPADLELRMTLACDRGDLAFPNGPTLRDRQRATVVMDMTWSHTDLLPSGLAGLVNGFDGGDTAGVRVVDPGSPGASYWELGDGQTIVDLETGATAGWWGSSSPSVEMLPTDVQGSLTVGIGAASIKPGHTIRATWPLLPVADGSVSWPRIEGMYAHLDRFLIAGTVGCGETAHGRQIPVPTDPPPPDNLYPF